MLKAERITTDWRTDVGSTGRLYVLALDGSHVAFFWQANGTVEVVRFDGSNPVVVQTQAWDGAGWPDQDHQDAQHAALGGGYILMIYGRFIARVVHWDGSALTFGEEITWTHSEFRLSNAGLTCVGSGRAVFHYGLNQSLDGESRSGHIKLLERSGSNLSVLDTYSYGTPAHDHYGGIVGTRTDEFVMRMTAPWPDKKWVRFTTSGDAITQTSNETLDFYDPDTRPFNYSIFHAEPGRGGGLASFWFWDDALSEEFYYFRSFSLCVDEAGAITIQYGEPDWGLGERSATSSMQFDAVEYFRWVGVQLGNPTERGVPGMSSGAKALLGFHYHDMSTGQVQYDTGRLNLVTGSTISCSTGGTKTKLDADGLGFTDVWLYSHDATDSQTAYGIVVINNYHGPVGLDWWRFSFGEVRRAPTVFAGH